MLLETLNQSQLFLIFLYFGMVLGIFFIFLLKLLQKLNKKVKKEDYFTKNTKKIKTAIKQKIKNFCFAVLTSVWVILICLSFYAVCYYYNFGQIRLFCVLGFVLGFLVVYKIGIVLKKYIIKRKLKKFANPQS